jgi:hypothetical protein
MAKSKPGEQISSKERSTSMPQESLQGVLAGYVPSISLSDVVGALTDPTGGRERQELIHPSSGDATEAYANNNDYYIYFYYIPSGGTAGVKESFVKFKAILTDFDDMYVSSWNEENIYGRMDSIATYQSTKRKINFGFDVVAGDLSEAINNYNNSKTLLSYLYPVYEEVSGAGFNTNSIKAPPLLKIKFANLINEKIGNANLPLVGKLDGLSYRPVMDLGFFEDQQKLYPKVNQFTCNFTVLHTQDPILSVTDLGRPDLRLAPSPSVTTKGTDDNKFNSKLGGRNIDNDSDATQAQLNAVRGGINETQILGGVKK